MNKKKSNSKKAVMIGCGFVGSASVFALMQSGLFTEIALIDADKNKAEGEAMDISHGIPFASPMKIYAGDYDDVADAAIVIISAGAGQKPGETRLDLLSYQYYSDPNYGWLILQANPTIGNMEFEIQDGERIRIPLPLDQVLIQYDTDIDKYNKYY